MLSRTEAAVRGRTATAALAVAGVAAYLLLVYLAQTLGPSRSAFPIWVAEGWNYAFAGIAILFIRVATPRLRRPFPAVPRSGAAALRLGLVLLFAAALITVFYVADLARWAPLFAAVHLDLRLAAALGMPSDVADLLATVLPAGLIMTALLVYLSLRYVRRFGPFGYYLQPPDWLLGSGLVVLAVLARLAEGPLLHNGATLGALVPITLWAVPLFFLQLLVNGLEEETLLRGYVLPQLQALLRQPVAAMLVMIAVFDLLHLPLNLLYLHEAVPAAVAQALFPIQPTGLVFGYAYWRSRSVVPGILMHTYTSLWAFPYL